MKKIEANHRRIYGLYCSSSHEWKWTGYRTVLKQGETHAVISTANETTWDPIYILHTAMNPPVLSDLLTTTMTLTSTEISFYGPVAFLLTVCTITFQG